MSDKKGILDTDLLATRQLWNSPFMRAVTEHMTDTVKYSAPRPLILRRSLEVDDLLLNRDTLRINPDRMSVTMTTAMPASAPVPTYDELVNAMQQYVAAATSLPSHMLEAIDRVDAKKVESKPATQIPVIDAPNTPDAWL